jgi:hypothetical protein
MGAKFYRFLSVVLIAVATSVIFTGCGPTVFGLGESENTEQPTPLSYGYVKTDLGNFYFRCGPVDELTSHIYLQSVFVNTSDEHITSATITVEFIDGEKYELYSSQYEVLAYVKVTVKNIPAGGQKKFGIAADVTVTDPENNLYRLYAYDKPTGILAKLSVFVYKVDYVIGETRPDIGEINGSYNFV